jgi:hypothetical protein
MIFAREINDGLTSLVKKLDADVAANRKEKKMAAFVVFLMEGEDKAEENIKKWQADNGIKNVSLAIDNPAGPRGYNIAKEADFTVVYYNKRKIEVNHAFKKSDFDVKTAEKVAGDVSKIIGG